MVQLADLISYMTKKYLEIENGYREEYSLDVKDIYRSFYTKIEQRLIRKTIVQYDTRVSAGNYYEILNSIKSDPLSCGEGEFINQFIANPRST